MKKFIYDQLIDRENICDMEKVRLEVAGLIDRGKNVVIFGPRNFGKTSLVSNVIIPDFYKEHKDAFVVFVDFLGVTDINSIVIRLKIAFEKAFSAAFPIKSMLSQINKFIKNVNASVNIDSLTGLPSLALEMSKDQPNYSITTIFNLIKNLSKKKSILMVMDEFQDIAKIEEAEALFRSEFQLLENIPIIIMGSQRDLLFDIFSKPKAPLASFGTDVIISPIDIEIYHNYIQERFALFNIKIGSEVTTYIQEKMQRVPEAINYLCDFLLQKAIGASINKIPSIEQVNAGINAILQSRQKRFESILYNLSSAEQKIMAEIAKSDYILNPTSKEFVSRTNITPRGISYAINKLYLLGMLEKENNKISITDPLLKYYLIEYR